MREGLLEILRCVSCKNSELRAEVLDRDENEIRKAKILCDSCGAVYSVNDGIADFIINRPREIENEQRAVEREEYLRDDKGNSYPVNRDSIERFKAQFLLLPEGDGSIYFRRGGCFQSIAEGSHRFYDTMTRMALKGREMILCLGDGFSYASYKFAQAGCNAVALDISNYLLASDIYVRNAYFERVFSDMHGMPFRDNAFDIVFCSAALHHSKKLKAAFQEIGRVLKQGGKLFVINESSRGSFEKKNPSFEDLKKRGYSDTSYTISEWVRSAIDSGFRQVKLELLSLAEDYLRRMEGKGSTRGFFLTLAYFLKRRKGLENFLLFFLRYPRILFRPRSWRMVCSKSDSRGRRTARPRESDMVYMTDNACKICGSEDYSIRLEFKDKKREIVACRACGAWRAMPYFLMDYSSREFYCEHYIKNEKLFRGFARDLVQRVFIYKQKGRFLDIGCSVGFLLEEALKLGFEAEGIELNEKAVEFALSRGLSVKNCGLESAGYNENTFDVVTLNHILEHIIEPAEFLQAVKKIIKVKGILVIGVPNHDSLIARLTGKSWYGWGIPEHVWHFDRLSLGNLLLNNGFRIRELIQNSQYYPFSKSLRKNSIALAARIGDRIRAGDQLIVVAEK